MFGKLSYKQLPHRSWKAPLCLEASCGASAFGKLKSLDVLDILMFKKCVCAMSTNIWVDYCSVRASFVWLSLHDFQGFFPFSTATSNRSIFFVIGSWASGKNVRRALGSLSGLSYFWSPNTTAKPSKIELYRSSIFSISRCWNMVRSKIAKCDRFRLSVRYYTFPLH